jgi:WD40 repeat protein
VFLFVTAKEKEKFTVYPTKSKIIFDICFFENGEKLAVGDNTNIKIFSTSSQKVLDEFSSAHSDRILAIDVSADDRLLASTGRDGKVVIWDLNKKSGLEIFALTGTVGTSLSFSTNNKYLAVGFSNGKTVIYDIENKLVKVELSEHKKDITSVKFSPNGKLLASASGDNTINLYSLEEMTLINTLKGHKNWVRNISFSFDEKLMSCGDDSKVILWDLSDFKNITQKRMRHIGLRIITSTDFFSDSISYVSTGITGKIIILSPVSSYKITLGLPINKAVFVPNEKHFMELVVATQGLGVIRIKAVNMKFSNRRMIK